MIKPTIGRVVWFWASSEHSWSGGPGGALPFAALVTFVHNDETVNLAVFDKEGDHIPHQCVSLWQGEGERPKGSYCEWMPYQKGQAAQSEVDKVALKEDVRALQDRTKVLEAKLLAGEYKAGQQSMNPPLGANLLSPNKT